MAERIEGLSIGLSLDTLQLSSGLKDLNAKMSLVNSEMKANLSAFDRGEKSVDKYQTRIDGLNKKLAVQEEMVEKSRKAYDKMVEAHGEGSAEAEKAAKAYNNQVANLNNLKGELNATTDDLQKLRQEQERSESGWARWGDSLDKNAQKLTSIGEGMKGLGDGLTKYVTAPLMAGGGLLLKSASDVDEAYKSIRTGTGATGAALEELKGSFDRVFKDVPLSAEETAAALADLQTRTGLMGPPLEDLTKQFISLGDIAGEEVPGLIEKGTRVFGDWGVEVENQGSTLDYFWKVSQGTGVGVQSLMEKVVQFGAPLRQLGFDFETSVALLGKFEKEGVNTELVMGSMRQALGRMAKEGIDAQAGLNQTVEAIKTAGSASEANALAIELFGARAGPDMAAAIREGRFEIEDFVGMMQESGETIAKADEETESLGEGFAQLKNEVMLAVQPMGEVLLGMARDILPLASEKLADFSHWLEESGEESLLTWAKIGGVLILAGPVLSVLGSFTMGLGSMMTAATNASLWLAGKGGLTVALGGLSTGFTTALAAAAPWITGIAGIIIAGKLLVDHLSEEAIPTVGNFGDEVSDTTAEAVNDFMELNQDATAELDYLFQSGTQITEEGAAKLTGLFDEMYNTLSTKANEKHQEQYTALSEFFTATEGSLDEHEQQMLSSMETHNQDQNATLQSYHDEANGIIAAAQAEGRVLTEEEHARLDELNRLMAENAISVLSESEQEQLIIKETLSREKGAIDARTAADTVARSKEAKDGVIAEANEQYEQVVAAAMYQRDETGAITAEEADKIIEEAKRQRDQTVTNAQSRHNEVVREAKAQAGEHVDEVNWETGEVLSKWEYLKQESGKKFSEMGQNIRTQWDSDIADLKNMWQGLVDNVNTIPGKMADGWNNTKATFGSAVADFMNAGISAVEGGVNAIGSGINWVMGQLGSDFRVPTWAAQRAYFLTGRIQWYKDGTDGHPGGPAVVGDGGMRELILYPNGKAMLSPDQDTLLNMPKGTQVVSGPDTKRLLGSIPQYAEGTGPLASIGSKLWDWVSGGAKSVLDNILSTMGFSMPSLSGFLGEMVQGGWRKMKDGAVDFLKGKLDGLFSFSGGTAAPETVRSWIAQAVRIAGVPESWLSPLTTIAMKESGGNPRAVNNWDINAINGIPSKGLMQTIGPTFEAYKFAGFNDIFNPVHNALAAINYIRSRYGNVFNVPGIRNLSQGLGYVGYATGGLIQDSGLYALAEEGWPEFVIPTNPARRTDAMKLLALAVKRIGGNRNQRPDDMGGSVPGDSAMAQLLQAVLEQNQILRELLAKESDVLMDKEKVGRLVAPTVKKENEKADYRRGRLEGVRTW